MPGPLPSKNPARRNAPTITTTQLPAGGRTGRPPTCPYPLAKSGRAWWRWAWKLPQATQWDAGTLYAAARRARLEDDLAAIEAIDATDLHELLGLEEQQLTDQLEWLIGKLQASAAKSTTLMREMRELDKRLGLDPKALSELRWAIVDPSAAAAPAAEKPAATGRSRPNLQAV